MSMRFGNEDEALKSFPASRTHAAAEVPDTGMFTLGREARRQGTPKDTRRLKTKWDHDWHRGWEFQDRFGKDNADLPVAESFTDLGRRLYRRGVAVADLRHHIPKGTSGRAHALSQMANGWQLEKQLQEGGAR